MARANNRIHSDKLSAIFDLCSWGVGYGVCCLVCKVSPELLRSYPPFTNCKIASKGIKNPTESVPRYLPLTMATRFPCVSKTGLPLLPGQTFILTCHKGRPLILLGGPLIVPWLTVPLRLIGQPIEKSISPTPKKLRPPSKET